jgi:transposase-like protein
MTGKNAVEERSRHSVEEKTRAVLSVWSEARTAEEVRSELGIGSSLLSQWQDRAMEGMVEALQGRDGGQSVSGPALSTKVKKLLEKKVEERAGRNVRLGKRLESIQKEPGSKKE